MLRDFPKQYTPGDTEDKWYTKWMESGLFYSDSASEKKPYSILMPPPNVTGILHFGHVLNMTIQDLYIRRKMMKGFEVCWFPGTDHAGIATQTKVERFIKEKENKSRYDLGREEFINKVWDWKEQYGGIILKQMRNLGVSADWSRTLFTLDESASNAVKEVFIRLFDEGLIYKGKKIINWSPLGMTALSDEEVIYKEIREKLYTLRYYLEDSNDYLQVATVRTETIFGDVAVAVNPTDERYAKYIGKRVIVPLVGRLVPVIPDEHADPEFGTGVVKITPAHDPNDFIVGERHNLEMINTINPDGTLNEHAGDFNGLERYAARKAILKRLRKLELIEKEEDYTHKIGYSERGGEPVEPYFSDQWFVNMKPLAEIALKPVQEGKINFHPAHWVKTYEHWMNNIKDWCISRQLWWGHRIPVYYDENGNFIAARDETEARNRLGLTSDSVLKQDEDVLDTWFSSWLWPLTTMKWMNDGIDEETSDIKKFLPTDLLVTAPDIIFFWVARMIMASMKFKNEIPFKDVYFTSTIRDGKGKKLSKSLGNSPDPLNIIDKYGADAIRFTIIYLSPLGQDVRMEVDVKNQDVPSVGLGRNFCNKVWNAGRFLMMKHDLVNIPDACPNKKNYTLTEDEYSLADKWIRSRLNSTILKLDTALDNFKVTEYSKLLYEFIWSDFCDWYIEILKVQLNGGEDYCYKQALMRFAIGIYEDILMLLHPVTPFITEEIYHLLKEISEDRSISKQPAPTANLLMINPELESKFGLLQQIVEELRKLRASVGIAPQTKLDVILSTNDEDKFELLESQREALSSLATCQKLRIEKSIEKPEGALASIVKDVQLFLMAGDSIDTEAERERLEKEAARLQSQVNGIEKKLSNEKFVNNAPAEIVEKERQKLKDMSDSLEKTRQNLSNIK